MNAELRSFVEQRLAALPFPVSPEDLLQRDAPGGLSEPGMRSANGHCRLVAARDGWVAVNLARPDDRELVPALTGRGGEPWQAVAAAARAECSRAFVLRAAELHLPVARVGEAMPTVLAQRTEGARAVRVIDLSALWAGPLCAGLLARAGSRVIRIDNSRRPDPTADASPRLDAWLNGGKHHVRFDLTTREGKADLRKHVFQADVLVTSARPPALERLGLDNNLLAANPDLIWAAITAHGWDTDRVGFGDDCAAAGGLVDWNSGQPLFMGDALADPLTGLEAALAVFERIKQKRGGRINLAMARIAASYAKAIGL